MSNYTDLELSVYFNVLCAQCNHYLEARVVIEHDKSTKIYVQPCERCHE